jgi:PAS domain S-box-containing protein
VVVATILPLCVAFALEAFFWSSSGRWSVLSGAVFVCAWFGGFESAVVATLLSVVVMWWFFVPPEHVIVKPAGPNYLFAVTFVLVNSAISAIISRLQRTTAALSRNQRLLQAVLDYSPEAIVVKDLDGRYVLVNKAFERLRGVKAEAALDRTASEILPRVIAEDLAAKEKIVRDTRQAILFEETTTVEGRVLLLSKFPLIDASNVMFGIGAIEADISQRKRDEQALREAMEDLRTAQRLSHVGSWRWDFRTNQARWSEELYRIAGLDPSRPPSPLVYPGARLLTAASLDRLLAAMEKLRRDGEPYDLDLEFTHPDGSVRWCATRGEPVRDDTNAIVGINGTVADITHIKELERLREEWTSIVAHDLRQPVSVISMASDFLPTLARASTEERDTLQSIRSATQTLKRMVDDLLDMSLLEANRLKLERTWIDPHALVGEIVRKLSPLSGARLKICENGPPVSVFADAMRIEQVLGNLISNALKYGDPAAPIDVLLDRTDSEISFAVTNRGKGISPDEIPRLFDRFMRSKTVPAGTKGLGLGLYISKGIIEAHGGRMWADSIPGETTTFYVALPLALEERAATQEAA